MTAVKAVLIPPFGPATRVEIDGYDDMREAVDGMVEALGVMGRADLTGYGNEEAKIIEPPMPPNARATYLVYGDPQEAYRRGEAMKAEYEAAGIAVIEVDLPDQPVLPYIAGPIVVCGFDANAGENADVPDDVAEFILGLSYPPAPPESEAA